MRYMRDSAPLQKVNRFQALTGATAMRIIAKAIIVKQLIPASLLWAVMEMTLQSACE
jgi:hypothetical protein